MFLISSASVRHQQGNVSPRSNAERSHGSVHAAGSASAYLAPMRTHDDATTASPPQSVQSSLQEFDRHFPNNAATTTDKYDVAPVLQEIVEEERSLALDDSARRNKRAGSPPQLQIGTIGSQSGDTNDRGVPEQNQGPKRRKACRPELHCPYYFHEGFKCKSTFPNIRSLEVHLSSVTLHEGFSYCKVCKRKYLPGVGMPHPAPGESEGKCTQKKCMNQRCQPREDSGNRAELNCGATGAAPSRYQIHDRTGDCKRAESVSTRDKWLIIFDVFCGDRRVPSWDEIQAPQTSQEPAPQSPPTRTPELAVIATALARSESVKAFVTRELPVARQLILQASLVPVYDAHNSVLSIEQRLDAQLQSIIDDLRDFLGHRGGGGANVIGSSRDGVAAFQTPLINLTTDSNQRAGPPLPHGEDVTASLYQTAPKGQTPEQVPSSHPFASPPPTVAGGAASQQQPRAEPDGRSEALAPAPTPLSVPLVPLERLNSTMSYAASQVWEGAAETDTQPDDHSQLGDGGRSFNNPDSDWRRFIREDEDWRRFVRDYASSTGGLGLSFHEAGQ